MKKTHRKSRQDQFLTLYESNANITKSCEALGIPRKLIYNWLDSDPEFKAKFEASEKLALGVLEDEAVRRAVQGVEKPIFWKGRKIADVKEYSDVLTIVLLKARAPHKYRENLRNEIVGPDGKPLELEHKVTHVHTGLPIANSEEDIKE